MAKPKQDNWAARFDAETIASAAAIMSDAKRLAAAKTAAKSMQAEMQAQAESAKKRAGAITKLAGSKPKKGR